MSAQVSCREGPYGRSFPFDLDGGIGDGLLGHSKVAQGDMYVRARESIEMRLCS